MKLKVKLANNIFFKINQILFVNLYSPLVVHNLYQAIKRWSDHLLHLCSHQNGSHSKIHQTFWLVVCLGQAENIPVGDTASNVHCLFFVFLHANQFLNDHNKVGTLFICDTTLQIPIAVIARSQNSFFLEQSSYGVLRILGCKLFLSILKDDGFILKICIVHLRQFSTVDLIHAVSENLHWLDRFNLILTCKDVFGSSRCMDLVDFFTGSLHSFLRWAFDAAKISSFKRLHLTSS